MKSKEGLTRREFLKASPALFLAACTLPRATENTLKASATGVPSEASPSQTKKPTETLTPTETVTPTETPDTRTYFERYVYPALLSEVGQRREAKQKADPEYEKRVDRNLNEERVNIALLGIGSERVLTDSIQVASIDTKSNEVRLIALERDTEAPEVARHLVTSRAFRINQAFYNGGFELTDKILEDATGLSIDFALTLDMEVMIRAVNQVFGGGLRVCVPWIVSDPNMGYFPSGFQYLTGDEVLRVSRARYYANNSARNEIQQYVLSAMLKEAKEKISEGGLSAAGFTTKAALFLTSEIKNGSIKTDFDSRIFIDLALELGKAVVEQGLAKGNGLGFPEFTVKYAPKMENVGDPYDVGRKKPLGGNPEGDIVEDYWGASRIEITKILQTPLEAVPEEYRLDSSTCP